MEVELGDVHLCIDLANESVIPMVFLKALLVKTKDFGKLWAFNVKERMVVLLHIQENLRRCHKTPQVRDIGRHLVLYRLVEARNQVYQPLRFSCVGLIGAV